jgi:Rrf2 family protein
MLLSRSCEYGLRATLYLASLESDGYVPIGTISDELDISFPFLTKIFQKLNDADLLTSQRGPSGGVALTRPPDEITLFEIVKAIDGLDLFTQCVLGLPGCGDEKPCPLHDRWAVERDRIERMFKTTSLAEMSEKIHLFDVRLAALRPE